MDIQEMIDQLEAEGYLVFENDEEVLDYADRFNEGRLVFEDEEELLDHVRANYWPNTVFPMHELIDNTVGMYQGEVIEYLRDMGYEVIDPKDKDDVKKIIEDLGESVIVYAKELGFMVFRDVDEMLEFVKDAVQNHM